MTIIQWLISKLSKHVPVYEENEPIEINWRKQDLQMICCQCGFMHRLKFVVSGHELRMRAYREERG